MSVTPRTDAIAVAIYGYGTCVSVYLARRLEIELEEAKDALRLIRDIGGTNHPEFAGLQCDGMWCARQARRALESIEGDK